MSKRLFKENVCTILYICIDLHVKSMVNQLENAKRSTKHLKKKKEKDSFFRQSLERSF